MNIRDRAKFFENFNKEKEEQHKKKKKIQTGYNINKKRQSILDKQNQQKQDTIQSQKKPAKSNKSNIKTNEDETKTSDLIKEEQKDQNQNTSETKIEEQKVEEKPQKKPAKSNKQNITTIKNDDFKKRSGKKEDDNVQISTKHADEMKKQLERQKVKRQVSLEGVKSIGGGGPPPPLPPPPGPGPPIQQKSSKKDSVKDKHNKQTGPSKSVKQTKLINPKKTVKIKKIDPIVKEQIQEEDFGIKFPFEKNGQLKGIFKPGEVNKQYMFIFDPINFQLKNFNNLEDIIFFDQAAKTCDELKYAFTNKNFNSIA